MTELEIAREKHMRELEIAREKEMKDREDRKPVKEEKKSGWPK